MTTHAPETGTPADRYRRAAFRLATAAKDLQAAAVELAAGKAGVAQTAADDLTHAWGILSALPTVPIAKGTAKR